MLMTGAWCAPQTRPGQVRGLARRGDEHAIARSRALSAKAEASAGVRCADRTRTSVSMPKDFSVLMQPLTTGKSESLPMITATFLLM